MQSDIVASKFGSGELPQTDPTMVMPASEDGRDQSIENEHISVDLNLRPQTAGNNNGVTDTIHSGGTGTDQASFSGGATKPPRSINNFQGAQVSSHYNLGPTTKHRLNEHGLRFRRRSTAGGAINTRQQMHLNSTGNYTPTLTQDGSTMYSLAAGNGGNSRFKKRLCSEP